jgi:hypothetical protein
MSEDKELATSLAFALEMVKLQQAEIIGLKVSVMALRHMLESSGKASLTFEDARLQVLEDNRENLHSDDEILSLLREHLEKIRSLAK